MFRFIGAALIVVLTAASADGGIITYTTRSSWEAAISGAITVENFNSYTSDTIGFLDLGPFTISDSDMIIDAPPLTGHAIDTTAYLKVEHDSTVATMIFDTPIVAWGAEYNHAQVDVELRFNSPTPGTFTLPNNTPTYTDPVFFGIVSTDAFTTLEFLAGTSFDRVGYDNVSFAAIPEPSTALLLGLGLVGMAARRRG